MEIKNLLALIKNRRTIRQFKADPIPDKYVHSILEAARWSPSGANSQPWEFIVIKDKATKNKIVELHKEHAKYFQKIELTREKKMRFPPMAEPKPVPGFKDAPVYIVVCGDPRTMECYPLGVVLEKSDNTFVSSLACAVLNMHLAATALGLAFQWVSQTASPLMETQLKRMLNIPSSLKIYDMVAIGYPAAFPKPKYLRKLEDIVHWEKYDKAKFRSDEQIKKFILKLRRT